MTMTKLCDRPLGLPKGSVRALLAMGIVGGGAFMLYRGILTFEQYVTMTTMVLAFYFSNRNADKVAEVKCEE